MNNIYIPLCILSGLVLTSCEKSFDPVPDAYNTILVMQEFGEKKINLYNTGEDGEYVFTVFKSGIEPNTATEVGVRILDENTLDIYSQNIGKSYKLLPAPLFQLKNEKLDFSVSELYKKGQVIFKTAEVDNLLKTEPNTNYVVPIELYKINAKDSINGERKLLLLKPSVLVPVISYTSSGETINVMGDGEETYDFKLLLPFVSPWDFECEVEPDLTGGNVFDASNFTLENNGKVFFKKGSRESLPLKIKFDKGKNAGLHTLPLKVKEISKTGVVKPNGNFLLKVGFNKLSLQQSMISANYTQKGDGQGIPGLIDGNPDTYYHSQWSGGYGTAPHYIQVQLASPIKKVAFGYQVRKGNANGAPQNIKISVSNDGSSWIELGQIDSGLPSNQASFYESAEYSSETTFTYVRFEVMRTTSGTAPIFFAFADFWMYGK